MDEIIATKRHTEKPKYISPARAPLAYKLLPDPRLLPGAEFLPIKLTTGRTRFPFEVGLTIRGGLLDFKDILGDESCEEGVGGIWYNARGEI